MSSLKRIPRLSLTPWRVLAASTLLLLSPWVAAQTLSQYVYDDDGRLRAVIAASGDAAVYEYDAVGNFTAIRRLAANELELITFTPRFGVVGTRVIFYGTGFGAGVSTVTFSGGATGTLIGFTNNTITAVVPAGAVTGPITITTARGQLTTSTPFTVQGIIIDPAEASTLDGSSVAFTATVVLPGDEQEIVWSVNGLEGGSPGFGTITNTGFYTPPLDPLASFDVVVQATSVAFPEIAGFATVHVRSLSDFRFAVSTGISVGKGSSFTNASALSQGVSIGKGVTFANAGALSQGVTVGRGPGFSDSAFSQSVLLTKGPIISAVAPANVSRGQTSSVTLNGSNFGGSTSIRLFDSTGSLTTGVTITNIVVSGTGTSLTFNLVLDSGTPTGRKFIVVTTPIAHSVMSDVNVNTLQITSP